jgi:tRNA 2-thiouridine synthesizing protein A
MATVKMDLTGLKCPQPAMKVASQMMSLKPGDVIEAVADCDTFENDVRGVCKRWNKVLLAVRDIGGGKKMAQVQI